MVSCVGQFLPILCESNWIHVATANVLIVWLMAREVRLGVFDVYDIARDDFGGPRCIRLASRMKHLIAIST